MTPQAKLTALEVWLRSGTTPFVAPPPTGRHGCEECGADVRDDQLVDDQDVRICPRCATETIVRLRVKLFAAGITP